MTIMMLCLKIVSKNNYQIGVKAVSSGGFANLLKILTDPPYSCCAKSLPGQALNEVDKTNKLIYPISSI